MYGSNQQQYFGRPPVPQPANTPPVGRLNQRSYSTGDLRTSLRSGEQQTKVVNENITNVESHFPQLIQDLNLYAVRSAKLRDAGDILTKSVQDYAASETPVLKQGLGAFSECFAAVQDHRNALVTRLENKVVPLFSVYETKCKQAKLDVKQHSVAHSKELNEHKSFERVKSRSNKQFALAKAETKFQKAAEEANRSAQTLNDQITDFERNKVRDLKKVFGDFMLNEMMFFAKALELYTHGYQELMNINEEEDVEQLQEQMKFEPHQVSGPTQYNMYGGSAPALMQPHQPSSHSSTVVHSNPNLDRTF